jgi:exopolyphosphatase / guanosine-5'-triphosphate,3'-diphosphate pyrophosphatase
MWAILDIGTNTLSMIIAQKNGKNKISILAETEEPIFIGHEGLEKKTITPEGINRLYDALQECKKLWEKYKIPLSHVKAVATSAMRNAKNGEALAGQIFEDFGVEIDIISGEKEAEYIYEGVKYCLGFSDKTVLVMDIGGGSVECILGNKDRIFWKKSIEIGGQRLKDMFGKNDPMSDIDIQNLDFHLELAFAPLINTLKHYVPEYLAGSAGCFETLACIHLDIENEKSIEIPKCKIRTEDFYTIYQKIINANLPQRQEMKGISHRAEMMPYAISLVKFIIQKSDVAEIQISNYSLREGYFLMLNTK